MNFGVSHDRSAEMIEAKTRWFRSLSVQERPFTLVALADDRHDVRYVVIGGVAEEQGA